MEPLGELHLLRDTPKADDLLGYQPYAEAMGTMLCADGLETPFTVGVFGRWGTGKSTFMNLLNDEVSLSGKGNGSYDTILFEPWQFDQKEEVWKALILSVLDYIELRTTSGKSFDEETLERVTGTLRSLALGVGRVALDKTLRSLTADAVNLDAVLDAYAATSRDNTNFINSFREEFKKLRDEVLSGEDNARGRLFVFVDDLDRCAPDTCIMVLEAIKLFFDLEQCVFVLGIDREVVQKGIEHKYDGNLSIRGQDYLDKMIQLPFTLPPVREETFRKYVTTLCRDLKFSDETEELITRAANGNPRSAKRLINCLQLAQFVANQVSIRGETPEIGDELDRNKLALLLTLQVRFPIAFAWLVANPIPYRDLAKGWSMSAFDESEVKEDTGYRAQLSNYLVENYGDPLADRNSNLFLALWGEGHNDIKVEEFKDKEELAAYIRIAGVVDDQSEEASETVTLRDQATGRYTRTQEGNRKDDKEDGRGAEERTGEENAVKDENTKTEYDDDDAPFLFEQSEGVLTRWKELLDLRGLRLWRRLPRLESTGLELRAEALHFLDELSNLGGLGARQRHLVGELSRIDIRQISRQISSGGAWCSFVAPIPFVMFSYLVESLIRLARAFFRLDTVDSIIMPSIPQFIYILQSGEGAIVAYLLLISALFAFLYGAVYFVSAQFTSADLYGRRFDTEIRHV